ncbi:cysteine dioxygenase type 1 [Lingula anatina]|uniref:Cysteine dioxygenase n=1 Tax=Lingula anatina TaxID=7574 RepID=A0A1S3HAJ2_LINAN|nr:cysteine dioxygenase type 1 [Lingula anatina]|eukprot:XP_013382471.1 cysteine dioxygenase type 1 [Lingula anatina]
MEDFVASKNIKIPQTLDDLIAGLYEAFSSDRVNVDYVHTLMSLYKSNPTEWKKFAKFDPHRYTRNLADGGNGKFNLIVLCWGEGQGSSIHSHADAHCFMKVLDGQLKESLYDWPEEEGQHMHKKAENIYKKNGVAYINDSLGLHRIENPSHSDTAVSLHLYCPAFDMCQCFDERTGHKHNSRVTFYSKYGERTPFCKFTDAVNDVMGGYTYDGHVPENN